MVSKGVGGRDYDVVVLGGGAGGMTAALVAALEGMAVCLIEKEPFVGGTTAWSGGMVWAPLTTLAGAAGHDSDTMKDVLDYLDGLIPGARTAKRMAAFLKAGPAAVDYLRARSQVQLRPLPVYPDYYPDQKGASAAGRVLEPIPFDASALGADLKLLRKPLPEFCLFGDMMVARADLPHFRNVYRSAHSLAVVIRSVAAHMIQKVRYGRGTKLVLGNALAARLLASLRDAGVDIRTRAPTQSLIQTEHGRVSGVRLSDGETIAAHRGVILATGGIGHDNQRRDGYLPGSVLGNSATAPGATGDGLSLGEAAGARISEGQQGNGFWAPVSHYQRRDGSHGIYPHTVADRAKPGLIAVNMIGERFINEAVSYHEFVKALFGQHNQASVAQETAAWLICDSRFLWKYGLGAVKPMTLRKRFYIRQGYLAMAETLSDLAREIGVPPDVLSRTISHFNDGAQHGQDPDFGRGTNPYQRFLGDAAHQPNPCVAPVITPPFFAVKVVPGDLGSSVGLETDSQAQILDKAGVPISGLFACGNDMHSVMEGAYPGPGITLGPAIAFGYLAAMTLVNTAP